MGIKHAKVVTTGTKGEAEDWNDDHVIDDDVDFDKNQATNLVIENVAAFPGGPVLGQIVYRTDSKQFFTWNGTDWIEYGEPTKEIFYPFNMQDRWGYPSNNACPLAWPNFTLAHQLGGTSFCDPMNFHVPHDFTALVSAELIGLFSITGNATYDICSTYAAVGEAVNTQQEASAAIVTAVVASQVAAIDISAILTGISALDYGAVAMFISLPDPCAFYIQGLRIRYI